MDKRLDTPRLVLRPFHADDLDAIHEQVFSDAEVCRTYCGDTRSRLETQAWLHYRILEAQHSVFHAWAIIDRASHRVLGLIQLRAFPNDLLRFPDAPLPRFNQIEAEMSFALGRSYWGRGFASEACRAVIDYAFRSLRLPRLVASIMDGNERSVRLHERLGFAVFRNQMSHDYVARLENAL
jgi:RimJ/RimL family protein N-acetyltransferase